MRATVIVIGALLSTVCAGAFAAEVIERQAKDTLTALELNHGDRLEFRLRGGRVFRLVLEDTSAAIVERVEPGGIVYRFEARVRVDGVPMTLRRYVCSQECFYEPYVIDGVRVWLDIVKDVFDLIPVRYPRKGNLQCVPRKDARIALQDATLRICPQQTRPWIDDPTNALDVGKCYNGDDCYLGPYLGQACHVGMDINHPRGNLLFAPIDFDTHGYFNSVAAGDNNNRWRGIRQWSNGDVWALQTHHLIELLVPQDGPLPAGVRYATTAGVHVGSHDHTHFEFKIGLPRTPTPERLAADGPDNSIAALIDFDDQSEAAQARPEVLHLDPWIVFWQIFEDRKARQAAIRAAMKPLSPARTGRPVSFAAEGSHAARGRDGITCYWTFGDGGWQRGAEVAHVFARPGVYPVTLVVDDGLNRAACTQHISITGKEVATSALALSSPGEPSFVRRPVHAMDVYGRPVQAIPHTLEFVARSTRPVPRPKIVRLRNLGGGALSQCDPPEIEYDDAEGWLTITPHGRANEQRLEVTANATGLKPGTYSATVWVTCDDATDSPQGFRVELLVPAERPESDVTVDDRDEGFFATPYFWVGHRFCRCPAERRGHGGFYLTAAASAESAAARGQFARFTPDLAAGRYEVSLSEQTPFSADTKLNVLVRHGHDEQRVRVEPSSSRMIGVFDFDEGMDGFVEIRAAGSQGTVIADAARFRPVGGDGR